MRCARCGADGAESDGHCPQCSDGTTTSDQHTAVAPGSAPPRLQLSGFAPGQAFGPRYTIVEEIGSGGMGQVFKAIDNHLHKTVALKLIRAGGAERAELAERFRRELALAQEVSHPNVCRVHDRGEIDGIPYISMEFVEGQGLDHLLRSVGTLSPRQVVSLARQVAAGLQAVHERGIIHRDLKPANVMVDRTGRALVLDFGVARHTGGDTITADGAVLGTLGYMSPEQALSNPVDARSDIYSFGAMLFEMLTGRRPPGDGIPIPLALREPNLRCPPPSQLVADVPAALDAVILRCLERDPGRRYQTVESLAQDLGASTGEPLPSSLRWSQTRWRPSTRRKLWAGASFVVGGLALVGLALLLGGDGRGGVGSAGERTVVAVLPLSQLGGEASDEYLGLGIADTLITHLAAVPEVTVVSRAATLAYRGQTPRAGTVARDLGATLVVEGVVQRAGDTLRVALSLVRPDDSLAWGEDFEGSLDQVFDLHERLARQLCAALHVTVSPGQRRRLDRPPTTDAEALASYYRARALLERPDISGNVEAAIRGFEAAIDRDHEFALAHAGLGEALWSKYQRTAQAADTTQALASITEAMRLDPEQPEIRVALATVYRATGRSEAAAQELERVIRLQPSNDEAFRLLGEILLDAGRSGEALAALRTAIELRPAYWGHHAAYGRALFQLGRYGEAVGAFERVTSLVPDNSRGFQMLGASYHAWGKTELARGSYQRAIELAPDSRAYTNLGNIYYSEGRFAEAAGAFREAARLEPGSPVMYLNLGDAYSRLARSDEASQAYARAVEVGDAALEVNPDDAEILAMTALCSARLGRYAEARRRAIAAATLAPTSGEVLYNLAAVHALAGARDEALAALRTALANGYSAALAREEEDLASLRGDPELERVLSASP